jgi:hypothetical protein
VRVALVTTWETACGIAEHSAFLKQAVEAADPDIEIVPVTDLHPHAVLERLAAWLDKPLVDLVVLNYHAALHSQWTPDAIRQVQEIHKIPVMVVYHDTGVPCNDQCLGIVAAADAAVVHEPCIEFRGTPHVFYWRMGVPAWPGKHYPWGRETFWKAWPGQPVLGSIGFPFPWKNYARLAEITAVCGWALYLIAPGAPAEEIALWQRLNPATFVVSGFMERDEAIRKLAACDATAFAYTCQNAGQSASILMGIAARQPVFAFEHCRQFRALYADPLANKYIRWCTGFAQLQERLPNVIPGRVDCGMVALAEQDGWPRLGHKFADLWQRLVVQDLPEPAA